ncbi:MAG TPA: hypothetical protein VFB60_04900 [Ktedonobacteraceae bacterium]|nr:hypothetical protein [Ktedonobacteraceae bacterium]
MQGAAKNAMIAGGILLLLLIIGIVLAAVFGVLLEVLYIFLMLLAALMVIATFLQIYSIFLLMRTVTTVRNEMSPLLASVQETIGIVKSTAKSAGNTVSTIGATTRLTSEAALGPSVRAVAAVVAGQQMLRIFLGKGHVRSRAEERRRQQMEAQAAAGGE